MKVEVDSPPPYEEEPNPQGLKITVTENGSSNFLVSITPPREPEKEEKAEAGKRAPLDLCCVIDVSGSMEMDAPVQSEDGKSKENTGLSVLDIVKHAMKTIIATMNDGDRLSIVTFSTRAELVTDFLSTTEAGKKDLNNKVEKLYPQASTNLWDGLKMGMNLLAQLQTGTTTAGSSSSAAETKAQKSDGRLASLFILTDGQPNIAPPRGHIPMLKQWLESNSEARFAINSFGFGYDLESQLMSDIARTGGGHYGFIPDAGMVGTVFVHALANLYATYATACHLNIEVPEGAKLKAPRGDFTYTEASWGAKVDIGDLQYGQTRDFIVELEGLSHGGPHDLIVTLAAKPWFAQDVLNESVSITTSPEPTQHSQDYEYHLHRLNLVTAIYAVCGKSDKAKGFIPNNELEEAKSAFQTQGQVIAANLSDHEPAKALGTDISGEVTLAVSDSAAWKKWGRHYFPSLARAHQMQRCNNFKDPGLQIYGSNSPLFIKSRDSADAEFDKLPPPTPSLAQAPIPSYGHGYGSSSARGSSTASWSAPKISSMSRYNMRGGVCFTADSLVILSNGTSVRMDTLRRGTQVMTAQGPAEVSAVVKTKISGGTAICRIGELKVTPWHPIFHEGKWQFPCDISPPQIEDHSAVYSVLLMPNPDVNAHTLIIDGVQVVTLGHGLVDDKYEQNGGDVRNHSFFGNYAAVFQGLVKLPGFFENGVCLCQGVERDGESGLIKGFVKPGEVDSLWDARVAETVDVRA